MTPSIDAPAPMRRALDQARLAIGLSNPDPRVGRVIVSPAGRMLSQGPTQQAGGPQAEAVTLRVARAGTRDGA